MGAWIIAQLLEKEMYPQQQMHWLVYVHDPSTGLPDICAQQLEYNPQMGQQGTSTYRLGVQSDPSARIELLPGYYVVVAPQVIPIPGFHYLGFVTDGGRVIPFTSRPGLQLNALLNSSMRLYNSTNGSHLGEVTPVIEIWRQLSQPNDPPIESRTPPPPTVGAEAPPIESSTPAPPNRVDPRSIPGGISNEEVAAAAKRTPSATSASPSKYRPAFRLPEVDSVSVEDQEARYQQRRESALAENSTIMKIETDEAGNLIIPDPPAPAENSAVPADAAPVSQAPAT